LVPTPRDPAATLVADDDRTIRAMAVPVLGRHGWRVTEAENGREAVDRSVVDPLDLVILDGVMPEMNGFEACGRIRALPKGDTGPILFVAALDDSESVDRASGAGASEYVNKPFHGAVLERRAQDLVRLHRSERLLQIEQARVLVRAEGWGGPVRLWVEDNGPLESWEARIQEIATERGRLRGRLTQEGKP